MPEVQPVIVGGNGHSGTRLFIEIIGHVGVFIEFARRQRQVAAKTCEYAIRDGRPWLSIFRYD